MHNDTRTKIREFLAPQLAGHELDDSDDIFALGYVNSLFAMQLAMFLERDLAVRLEPEDLDFANFRSVDALARLVETKARAA